MTKGHRKALTKALTDILKTKQNRQTKKTFEMKRKITTVMIKEYTMQVMHNAIVHNRLKSVHLIHEQQQHYPSQLPPVLWFSMS